MKQSNVAWWAGAALVGWLGMQAIRRRRRVDLNGQVVLITGGSRGLGYLMAREFARQGCRLSICARDEVELERARQDLGRQGAEVLAVPCDVTDKSQVQQWVNKALHRFGRIDILVNNAGIIQVGPLRTMTQGDFEEAMQVMFWGAFHPIWAVLPHMRRRRRGQIINITSIGGKISVPHLLPYSCAKAAQISLSEGLRAELAPYGISVTTIVPGLMRTGSHLNAFFKGKQMDEYTWFSMGATLPFVSMNAERAARQVVGATRHKEAEVVLSLPANLAARFHGLFPGVTANLAGWVTGLILPPANGSGPEMVRGMEISQELPPARQRILDKLTALGYRAARRYHQYPGPLKVLTELDETKDVSYTDLRYS